LSQTIRATRCVPTIVLYTNLEAEFDKLETVVGRLLTTLATVAVFHYYSIGQHC